MNMFLRIFMVASVSSLAHAMDEQRAGGDDSQHAAAIAFFVEPATPEAKTEVEQEGGQAFALQRQLGRADLLAPNKDLRAREEELAQQIATRVREAGETGDERG